jgi:hypothetical protein
MYAKPRNEYEVEGNMLYITTPPAERFVRKVSGTSLAEVVGLSPWATMFKGECKLLGLCDEDISTKPAVVAGKVLEDVIIEHCRHLGVVPASEVFEPRTGDHDEWPSDFDDPDFVGHLDGMTADGTKVVEVKTTGRPEDWAEGPPIHYWLQASLYAHFMGVEDIMFLVGVLTDEDRRNPLQWNPAGHVYKVEVKIHPQIEEYIKQARMIRSILTQNAPIAIRASDDPRDKELMDYFQARQTTGPDLYDLASELATAENVIKAIEEEHKDLYERVKSLRESLKTAMTANNTENITTPAGGYKLVRSTRSSLSRSLMIEDGLDPDKYCTTTETYTLRRD